MSSSKSNFFGRAWDRARGKSDVERICKKVFEELADKDTELLDINNSLHIATLMVYNSINKQVIGPHKDPPCMKIIADKMKEYGDKGIAFAEFQELILMWVEKDLRLVLAHKAAIAILGAPLLAVTAKNAGRQVPVPRISDAVEKVPTPLMAAVFSVGLMFLQDVRWGRQRD